MSWLVKRHFQLHRLRRMQSKACLATVAIYILHLNRVMVATYLRRLVAVFPPRRPGSNTGLVVWDYVMDKSGAGVGFLRELRFHYHPRLPQ
jgi:hypothetical protein